MVLAEIGHRIDGFVYGQLVGNWVYPWLSWILVNWPGHGLIEAELGLMDGVAVWVILVYGFGLWLRWFMVALFRIAGLKLKHTALVLCGLFGDCECGLPRV